MSTLDRRAVWVALLQQLTEEVPGWLAWRRYEPALSEDEDVDAVAPIDAWPHVTQVFASWASQHGMSAVVCRHIPYTLNLFAVAADGTLLQLETRHQHTFRGSVQFTAGDLLPLTRVDADGVRVLRPGAEALLLTTLHGLRRGGRANFDALEAKGVPSALAHDPDGVAGMARALGTVGRPLRANAQAVAVGGWNRPAMLVVEAIAAVRALARPDITIRRSWFRSVVRPRCPVLQTVYADGRRVQGSRSAWVARAAASGHTVLVDGRDAGSPEAMPSTSGRFVVLVGPDGVGKTTIAQTLLDGHPGERAYVYFRPPLRGTLPATPPTGPRPRGRKVPPPEPQFLGWLRLAKNMAWFWIGYLRVVRPVLQRGGFVVGDRWSYSYVGQPGGLRFMGPHWLARLATRVMPHPDLVVNLTAPPAVVVGRKDELTVEQVTAELEVWRGLPVPRLHTVDAGGTPDRIADQVRAALATQRRRIIPSGARR